MRQMWQQVISQLGVALEDDSSGKAVKEIEMVFYAKVADKLELQNAQSSEHQEQWELKISKCETNAGNGQIRVRKTVKGDTAPEYVLTMKVQVNAAGDRIEVGIPTTEAMFNQFKVLCSLGMKKDRYFFPDATTGLVYEVDMFLLPGSKAGEFRYHDWCKIDLELQNHDQQIPPFPIKLETVITAQNGKRTSAEEKVVGDLYETMFRTKNEYLKDVLLA